MSPRVVVVGAGAAGLMAAIAAREAGAEVTLVEGTAHGGRKILISGGGRCNVLPGDAAPDRFVSEAPRSLVRAMLGAWPLREQVVYFEDVLGVPLALETESGKRFPASDRARDVHDALVRRAGDLGVTRRFGTAVRSIEPVGAGWRVSAGGEIDADRVVVATGGLSVPATGSTGFGFDLARRFGLTVHPTYPALTPLTASPHRHVALAGISAAVTIAAGRPGSRDRLVSRGGLLVTHRGYSGPVVLDVSHVAVRSLLDDPPDARARLRVQWAPLDAGGWTRWLGEQRGLVRTAVGRHVPQRLADALMAEAGVPPDRTCGQLRREERTSLLSILTEYDLPWTGHEGYRPAEVTGGGVALEELHRRTLESRRAPGLHFCGEVLDAFGPIGGHNFQWAWSTGRSAGLGAARLVPPS
ncbi:MAG: aminoacetone oxidase family FAD-binding enzyme [Vicinamibacterales bacterium]